MIDLSVVPHGTGRHVWSGPPDALKAWALGLFISEICYAVAIATAKWSILSFYWRIFGVRESIRLPIRILAVIVAAWAMAMFLVIMFQCMPLRAVWQQYDPFNPINPGEFTCGVRLKDFFKGNSIPNILTDVCMVMLPLPYIWKLQLPRRQKIALAGIFALARVLFGTRRLVLVNLSKLLPPRLCYSVTVVSIIRLRLLIHLDLESPDITYNFVTSWIWSVIEVNIGIVCACLPSLKPLLSLAVKWTTVMSGEAGSDQRPAEGNTFMNTFLRRGRPAKKSRSDTLDDERPFAPLNDAEAQTTSGSGLELRDMGAREAHESDAITVTREFRIQDSDQ
ncbi:hypothetical protein PG993_007079 [Apiospora rasikravindrae]|uniref:Rhodopsin domain-containing protein n=1 Tax=Apiospora rasikravindrae TaxID=990691 RepID=A0ABR1SWH6_9PEZI